MNRRDARRETGLAFSEAVSVLDDVRVRAEVTLGEMPAPQRIAPHALALTAEVAVRPGEEPVATGRFVVLHDPDSPEAWDGSWRLVTYARADLEPELAGDPLLGDVGWSWLTDALDEDELAYRALGGTVTHVVSESHGTLADREASVEMEIRASWTPEPEDLAAHLLAWTTMLCTVGGLPPLPEGVTPLPGRTR